MESIFNQIFEFCADSEKLHQQDKDKFSYKVFGYKKIKRRYKDLYKLIDHIKEIDDIKVFEVLLSDYIDTLSTAKDFSGHCKSADTISTVDNKRSAVFEYNSGINKVILTCVKDRYNIFCNFRITEKGKNIIKFDEDFTKIQTKDEDTDSTLSEIAMKAQVALIPMLKDDIIRFLNGFVLDSEGRLQINGTEKGSNKK